MLMMMMMMILLISHNSDNHKTGANRVKEDGGLPLPLLLQLGVALLLAAALLGSLALLVSRVHWRPHPQGTCSAFACLCARNYSHIHLFVLISCGQSDMSAKWSTQIHIS